MKVAVIVWQNRISPALYASHMFLVGEAENATVIGREYIGFDPETPSSLIQTLARMDVSGIQRRNNRCTMWSSE